MKIRLLSCLLASLFFSSAASADLFLVKTSDGPGFADPQEAATVLENGILPLFDALAELKKQKKIVSGGLPIGSRTLMLIVEADSHDEVDRMLRDLPAWGVFKWKVVPMQSLAGRAKMEREVLDAMK